MKQLKTKISKTPFELIGYRVEVYLKWCEIHNFKPYLKTSKKEFFRRVNKFIITKRNKRFFEEGKEIIIHEESNPKSLH